MRPDHRRRSRNNLVFIAIAGLALLVMVTSGAWAAPLPPETPAGRALSGWLQAFNSGDRTRLEAFDNTHAPWLNLDGMMALRTRTGGYELTGIKGNGALWITFQAKEIATSAPISGSLVVKSSDHAHISELALASGKSSNVSIDAAEIDHAIDGALKQLDAFYVSVPIAHKIAADIRAQRTRGVYDGITDGQVLATRLMDDMRAASGDNHIFVSFRPSEIPVDFPKYKRPDLDPALGRMLLADNCGFEKAEHVAPDIGYLKLDMLGEPKFCGATAVAAMGFLANSDALIIDLRDDHGGSPQMVALICSYLFDEPTHLDDQYGRGNALTEQLWTLPYFPGKQFLDKPVYVLVSRQTFSAAEEFAFDLKNLKRATVVGETTGGGANSVSPHRIDGHFIIGVPFARIVNPTTKTNWEGTGVQPDVSVPAAAALDTAEKLARAEIAKASPAPDDRH